MIGLAVGIDYSLFILSRYREERARGLQKIAAIVAAGSTASRAVLFSGLTVVLALVGLLIVPHSLWISLGVGAILVVVVAVMASLTLLPAMLSLMGDGVDKLRIPMIGRRRTDGEPGRSGLWDRVSAAVMRRPLVSLLVTGSLLMMAALPLFDMNTGNFGVSTFPDESRAKEGYSVLIREFGFGVNDPVEIVIDGDATSSEVQRAIQDVRTALATDAAFGPSNLVVDDSGRLALVSVPLVGDATGEEAAVKAVRTVRRDYVPNAFDGVAAEVFVTGTTAEQVDFVDLSEEYRPLIMFVVLGLSFVLLTLVFRSLVIALKAIVMNLLSVGAAYGLLVLVFQKGIGNEIFGFPQVEVIQA